MAANASYTITLTTDGAGQVRVALNEVATIAQTSADRTVAAYGQTAAAAEAAAAREAAAAKRVEDAERRRMAATARRITDTLDPSAPAQRTLDRESASAGAALQKGLISQQQYDAYLQKLKLDLVATTGAMKEHGGVLGLNRIQYLTAQSAVLRFTDSIIAGRNPITALSLESHKLVEIMSLSDGGMAGAMRVVAGLFSPLTIGAGLFGAALVAGAAAAYEYSVQLDRLEGAAAGYGRTSQLTGDQLMQLAQANAQVGQVSVGAAQAIEEAILHETRTSGDALGDAIKVTQKFADAMGIDTTKAAEQLGKAMADPVKGVDDLTRRYGYFTPEQVKLIHEMMEQNDLLGAQKVLLDGLGQALDRSGDHVTAFTKLMRDLTAAASESISQVGEALAHLAGYYSNADKIGQLRGEIFADQELLRQRGGSQIGYNEAATRKELADKQRQLADLLRTDASARPNQQSTEVRDIVAKYGLDRDVEPRLEALKNDLKKLEDAQHAGQHVNVETLDALRHAVRTFMTPEQQRIAEQQARAALRQAAPHSAEREAAGQRLMDAVTAGQVVTEAGARDLAQARGEQALGHARGDGGARKAEAAARAAAAMVAETAASLDLADAYLKSGSAALQAEARRKAATEATRKGADVDGRSDQRDHRRRYRFERGRGDCRHRGARCGFCRAGQRGDQCHHQTQHSAPGRDHHTCHRRKPAHRDPGHRRCRRHIVRCVQLGRIQRHRLGMPDHRAGRSPV